jgi:hypothetical protein
MKHKLTPETLAGMLNLVRNTRDEELDCGDCYEQMDRFAEMKLVGRPAEELMPMVEAHMDTCPCCREEFAMLLESLRAMKQGERL